MAYGPIAVGPFSASTASVVVTVSSEWRNKDGIGGAAAAERSITFEPFRDHGLSAEGGDSDSDPYTADSAAPGTVVLSQGPGYTWSQAGNAVRHDVHRYCHRGLRAHRADSVGPWRLAQLTSEDEECYVPPVEVTPEYTYTAPTCDAPGSYTVAENEGYTWQDNEDGTFTAVANDNFVLADGDWTVGPFPTDQLTGEVCPTPTPPPGPPAPAAQFAGRLEFTDAPARTRRSGSGCCSFAPVPTQLPSTGSSSWMMALIALVTCSAERRWFV